MNVIVINFDPGLKTRGNLKLRQHMKWSDPWQLTEKMVENARLASGGYVDYRILEKIEQDGFTTFRNASPTPRNPSSGYADDWLTYPKLPRQKRRLIEFTWEDRSGDGPLVRQHMHQKSRIYDNFLPIMVA